MCVRTINKTHAFCFILGLISGILRTISRIKRYVNHFNVNRDLMLLLSLFDLEFDLELFSDNLE